MQLIPAIDLLDGEVVRLYQGDFSQRTRYAHEPVSLATQWRDAGITALHVVDLNAARGDAAGNESSWRKLAAIAGLRVQLAGGVRDAASLRARLHAGAVRVVIGTLAVEDPELVAAWIKDFGAERIVVALDVRLSEAGKPVLTTHGWRRATSSDFYDLLDAYRDAGLRHLLCTDVGRDGTLSGPNLELYRAMRKRYPQLAIQASGGIGGLADVEALASAGLAAAILGRALLDARLSLDEALGVSA